VQFTRLDADFILPEKHEFPEKQANQERNGQSDN